MKLRSSSSGKYPLDLSMRKMTVSAAAPFSNEATMSKIRVFWMTSGLVLMRCQRRSALIFSLAIS